MTGGNPQANLPPISPYSTFQRSPLANPWINLTSATHLLLLLLPDADVAELVDALDLGSSVLVT